MTLIHLLRIYLLYLAAFNQHDSFLVIKIIFLKLLSVYNFVSLLNHFYNIVFINYVIANVAIKFNNYLHCHVKKPLHVS